VVVVVVVSVAVVVVAADGVHPHDDAAESPGSRASTTATVEQGSMAWLASEKVLRTASTSVP
jgi:hypothetical protein